ncbi:transcription factor bHLH104-like [Zingiber officinale]|uniref:transcription factor bHLH104-like n=1 Tax=Zingiber officinale TaxID=94328 RepID=UPI001C4BB928|nr:transcription factor bHLH104-like [Zingiber officinale]
MWLKAAVHLLRFRAVACPRHPRKKKKTAASHQKKKHRPRALATFLSASHGPLGERTPLREPPPSPTLNSSPRATALSASELLSATSHLPSREPPHLPRREHPRATFLSASSLLTASPSRSGQTPSSLRATALSASPSRSAGASLSEPGRIREKQNRLSPVLPLRVLPLRPLPRPLRREFNNQTCTRKPSIPRCENYWLLHLTAEKNELREEKQKLKAEKESLEQQIKLLNTRSSSNAAHPPVIPTPFTIPGQPAGHKLMMVIIGYPSYPMWQFMPPADVDTSLDADKCPPVA